MTITEYGIKCNKTDICKVLKFAALGGQHLKKLWLTMDH